MNGKDNTKLTKEKYKIKDIFDESSKIHISKIYRKSLIYYRKYGINILSGTQETFEALSHFLYNLEVTLKEYKTNEQLIEYLIYKNVIIEDQTKALRNLENLLYMSLIKT